MSRSAWIKVSWPAAALAPLLAFAGDESAGQTASSQSVIVTGSRISSLKNEDTNSVSLITRQDIEKMAPANMADLLRQVPGLQVDQLGGPGGISQVYIRGGDPNHVLVLIDGVRVNDPTNSRGGSFDMSSIDPAIVDRVEVLRGASSAIYGADAISGVINITTLVRVPSAAARATVGAGGNGYQTASGLASLTTDSAHVRVFASTLRDGLAEHGGSVHLAQGAINAGLTLPDATSVDSNLQLVRRDGTAYPDDSGGALYAAIRTLEARRDDDARVGVAARHAFGLSTVTISFTGFNHTEDDNSPGVAPGERNPIGVPASKSHTHYDQYTASADAVFKPSNSIDLVAGSTIGREHGDTSTQYELFGSVIPANFDLGRTTVSYYGEAKWRVSKQLVGSAGWRRDDVHGVGSASSPSVGLAYNVEATSGTLRANFGEGFKPPSFFALGLPTALGGDPSLRPEHGKSASLGYDQPATGRWPAWSVSAFDTRYRDLITFDNATNKLVNADRVKIHGVEFESTWQPTPWLQAQGQFTWLQSRVANSDEPLRERPGRRASVNLVATPNNSSTLEWRVTSVSDAFDSSVPTGGMMLPTYVRNDLTWTQRLAPPSRWLGALNISAAVDNVFNKSDEAYIGQPGQDRRIRLQLSLRF